MHSTTLAAALYLLLLRYLHRQYKEVIRLVDTVSVFLPAADAMTYDALLMPRAAGGFEDACEFVRRAAASGMRVEVTAVDRPDVAVADVEALAGRLGATDFRTRSWLGNT